MTGNGSLKGDSVDLGATGGDVLAIEKQDESRDGPANGRSRRVMPFYRCVTERERGQSTAELAVVLPVLIIMMVLVAESGFLLRNYLLVTSANREAARLAARGRYTDERVGERAVVAGGIVNMNGTDVPFLRTHGTEPNTGLIVTHIPMDAEGDLIQGEPLTRTTWVSGVIASPDGDFRPVQPAPGPQQLSPDSHIDRDDIVNRHGQVTGSVAQHREDALYEATENHVVVVETFFAHEPLMLTELFPVQAVIPVYTRSTVRVTLAHATEAD
jgi:hypothetical protein